MALASISMPSTASGVDTANNAGSAADSTSAEPNMRFDALFMLSMASACPANIPQDSLTNEPTPQDEDAKREDPAAAVQNLMMLLPATPSPATDRGLPQSPAKPDSDSIASNNLATLPDGRTGLCPVAVYEQAGLEKSEPHSDESNTAFKSELKQIERAPAVEAFTQLELGTLAAHPSSPVESSIPLQKNVFPLHAPLGSSGWNREFSQQISWMSRNDLHSASLLLNPPELGPVQVELQLTGAETIATFSSPVPEVRQAIEAALPELKALMEESGLHLASAGVDQDSRHLHTGGDRERQARRHATTRNDNPSSGDSVEVTNTSATTHALHPQLLDLYA